MELPQTEDTLVTDNNSQLKLSARELLLQQLARTHTQLREQEKLTTEVLAEKRVLEEKVKWLELQLKARDRDLTAAKTAQDRNTSTLGEAIGETPVGRKEVNVAVEKVLQNRAGVHSAQEASRVRTDTSAQHTLRSRRPYVCLIIDGDANHFLPTLYKAGARGGEVAAERVKQEVSKLVAKRPHIPDTYVLKVQVFMNRQGFVDTVNRCDRTPKELIGSCLDRFCQSQPTWDLVDTGGLRESADTKVKANFNFFVEDSDCLAMIMGVCSDNGYVQMLQPFQGNAEKMSKIMLLASYDTTLNIQGLTYAIVQWPTVFRSRSASSRNPFGMAGVRTKDVTPLEDSLRITLSSTTSSMERLTEVPPAQQISKRKKRKNRSMASPNAPQSPVARHKSVSATSNIKRPQSINQRDDSCLHRKQDAGPYTQNGLQAKNDTFANNDVPTSTLHLHAQSTSDLPEPNDELTDSFDSPETPCTPTPRQGTSVVGLFSRLHGVLPFALPVARNEAYSVARALTFASSNPDSLVQRPQQSTKPPLVTPKSGSNEIFASSIDTPYTTESFIHVPKPNRAKSATYDPDRFLYHQSPEYLHFNKTCLDAIIHYARTHQSAIPVGQQRKLNGRLRIAEILLTRLSLALEIQSLEDDAATGGILCPSPSQEQRRDSFTFEWNLYNRLSNSLKRRVREDIYQLAQRTLESGLARLDFQKLEVMSPDAMRLTTRTSSRRPTGTYTADYRGR